MTGQKVSWPWHPDDMTAKAPNSTTGGVTSGEQAAVLAARCFRGADGNRFLAYLRTLTLDRALGPEASDAVLRHVEGQRQLVQHICNLITQGRGNEPDLANLSTETDKGDPS